MDFHSLTRRELQTLCKKNKIPANITNAAMADALKALEIVEGIEEFLEPCQSEVAHSSVESPTRLEVTSPHVPPTGGRTTRRGNVPKEEPVTVNPMTRSRRTTRKALTKHADESQAGAIETPALAVQTHKKKVQIASTRRKMDCQLKEYVEDEKKDSSETPAEQGVSSQRRVVSEDSAVMRVYTTRRSARLAEKNMEVLNDVEDVESEIFKKESLTKDGGENEEVNLNEALDDVAEVSEITGAEVIPAMEESSENKDKSEGGSAKERDTSSKEIKSGSTAAEEACIDFEVVTKLDEEKCDKAEDPHGENIVVLLNLSNEAEQTDGPYDICISGNETTAEKTEEYTGPEEKVADFVENVVEIKDNELSCALGFTYEIEKESSKNKDIENIPDFTVTMEKFTELKLQQATEEVSEADSDSIDQLAIPLQLNKDEPDKAEILQLEEHEKAADPVPSEAAPYDGEVAEAAANAFASIKNSPIKQQGGVSLLSASKTSTTMKRTIVFSDNKENITMRIGKNTAENVENLNELSVRKLTKMLKEKLEITKKSSKNDHDKEVLSRPALQALTENRSVDETKS